MKPFCMSKLILAAFVTFSASALLLLTPASALMADDDPYDRTEATYCGLACHSPVAEDVQPFILEGFLKSSHANSWGESNGNTYCTKCHAPFQADPLATYGDHLPVAIEESEAITCRSCHPPHSLRVEWETPIGNYDVAAGEWFPVYDPNDLCEHCHTGSRHGTDFQAMGNVMFEHKGVKCINCHMPKMPVELVDGSIRMSRSHNWNWELDNPEALATKAMFSCGTEGIGCHSRHKHSWAVKQILKGLIHGGQNGNAKGKNK